MKARPLLVGIGAAVLLAGCGDDTTGFSSNPDLSAHIDMGIPHVDLGKPPTD